MASHNARHSQTHLFLSYASNDRASALALAADLETSGVSVWIDRTGIAGGAAWAEEIVGAIRSASAVVVLCTRASMESRNVRQELQLAWDEDRPILPVLLEPADFPDSIAFFVKGRQWIELFDLPATEWAVSIAAAAKRYGFAQSVKTEPSAPSRISFPPAPTIPLIGRDAEVEQIVTSIRSGDRRLVTLTGPGGVGKTRLALEVAQRVADAFDEGVYFVDLSPVRDPEHVAGSIARVLGVREYGDRPARDRLLTELGAQHCLLVLDNFEQIIDAAPQLTELLAAAPELHMLITSREALRVRGEEVITIDPFVRPSEPVLGNDQAEPGNPAIDLFVATAQSVRPGFALSPQNAPVIAEICWRLDGLPLAIELAATRVKHFPPELVLSRLRQRLPVLTGGSRDSPLRHQTLRDTITWSYDLLEADEQHLLRTIGVFAGGASFEAIETIALAASPSSDVMAGLASLVDKSLVIERESPDGAPRFSMLETLREFALGALAETGELEQVRESYLQWCVSFAEAANIAINIEQTGAVLARIDTDFDNMATAIAWSLEHKRADLAVRLTSSLWFYWYFHGLYSQGRAWLERALALGGAVSIPATAQALLSIGQLAHYQGDAQASARAIDASLAIAHSLDSPRLRGFAFLFQGIALEDAGDFAEAENRFSQAHAEFHKAGDRALVLWTITHTGITWLGRNDVDQAIACFETVQSEFESVHDSGLMATATTLLYYGLAKCQLGEYTEAAAALAEAFDIDVSLADREGIAMDLAGLSVLAAGVELPMESMRLMGAAENIRSHIGLRPFAPPERTQFQQAMDRARRTLGDETFEQEWAIGYSSLLEQRRGDIDRVIAATRT